MNNLVFPLQNYKVLQGQLGCGKVHIRRTRCDVAHLTVVKREMAHCYKKFGTYLGLESVVYKNMILNNRQARVVNTLIAISTTQMHEKYSI